MSDGLTFTYDPNAAFGARIDDSSVQLNGAPLDPASRTGSRPTASWLTAATRFTVFHEGTNRIGGGDDLQALNTYLGDNSPLAPPPDRIAGI